MDYPESLNLIKKMRKDIADNGVVAETLVADLKELRPYAIEAEEPTLTKVIRLTYEMLEESGTFSIGIPSEGEENEEGELVIEAIEVEAAESLDYLLGLMENVKNPANREDLMFYRNQLVG